MRRLLITAFALAALPVVAAQGPVLPQNVRAAGDRITAEQLSRDLAFLASDELRGRNTPSPGYDAAARFIVERLEKGAVELEESIAIYERGEALREHCDRLLRQAEAKVEKLTLAPNGVPTGTEPFRPQE